MVSGDFTESAARFEPFKPPQRTDHYRMQKLGLFALVIMVVCLTGCSSLKPRDFAQSTTKFEPDEYYLGKVSSWGVMENRRGEPHSRFTTESFGTREADGTTTIKQRFFYPGGKTQDRLWQVHRLDAHRYEATANDVVGKAHGVADGNVFRWEYTIALKPGNPFSHVHLKQWMYLPEETDTLFTRVVVTKLGIRVGEVAETFRHIPPEK
jgi:hypothetical protein